jgi:hypothetical protein
MSALAHPDPADDVVRRVLHALNRWNSVLPVPHLDDFLAIATPPNGATFLTSVFIHVSPHEGPEVWEPMLPVTKRWRAVRRPQRCGFQRSIYLEDYPRSSP